MITAFCCPLPEGTAEVACAKYFISLLRRHGSLPFRPIPRDESWATIKVALSGDEVDVDMMRIKVGIEAVCLLWIAPIHRLKR